MSRRFFALSLLVPFLFLGVVAQATTVVRMGLRDMTASSTSIVHGTIVGTLAHWNEDATMIVTEISVRIDESLKGRRTGVVIVTQPGGVLDGLRTEVPGAPTFRAGDEVVLFLAPGPSRQTFINGLFQGSLRVVRDPKTGEKHVQGIPADGRTFLVPSSAGDKLAESPPGAQKPMSLDRFLGDLRVLIQETEQTEEK